MVAGMDKKHHVTENSTISTISENYYNSTSILVRDHEGSVRIKSAGKAVTIEPYNPYDHRVVQHPNGFAGAFIHIVKTSLGTGILAIPRAFKSAGLLVGFIGTILVGIMCTHAIHILVKASQKICRKTNTPSLGFADTAEGVFMLGPTGLRKYSKFAKLFVEGGLFSIHFLADCVYVVFISITISKLLSAYYPDVDMWSDYTFKLIIFGPLIICAQVRELRHLVPFSFIANVMLIVTFSITGYYMFSDISTIDFKGRHLSTSLSGIPSFFSTVLFSMEGIGTIMPVENSMITSDFLGCPGVLNVAMALIITLYTCIGFLGYYRFGEETAATITVNLPTDEVLSQVAQGAIAIAVFFSFMLIFYVPVDIVWSKLKHRVPKDRHNSGQIILRSLLIMLITAIAILGGENLGLLIDVVGAVFLSTLGLFVPAFLDVIVDWEDGWGIFHWRLIKDIIIMLLAVFGLISGVFYAILDVVD